MVSSESGEGGRWLRLDGARASDQAQSPERTGGAGGERKEMGAKGRRLFSGAWYIIFESLVNTLCVPGIIRST